MGEHFTRNTLECTAWCRKCLRYTQHRVDGGRRGPCIDPEHPVQAMTKAQMKRQEKRDREKQQPALFEEKK